MPKQCCTHFDGDSCTSNYHTSTEKVSVFRFPKPIKERTKWIGSLPTIAEVNDENVICEKHWPKDFPLQKCQGPLGYKPIYPSSEFGTIPACCLPQTPSVVERNIGNRNVSAESRAKRAKLDDDQCNLIKCWDDLKTYCQGLSSVYDLRTELINFIALKENHHLLFIQFP